MLEIWLISYGNSQRLIVANNKKDSSVQRGASRKTTYRRSARGFSKGLVSLFLVIGSLLPALAHANIISDLIVSIAFAAGGTTAVSPLDNLQTMQLPKPARNTNPSSTGGGDVNIVDNSALVPEEGPSGTIADIEKPKTATISTYVVRPGDTLSEIAQLFGVSPSTILWANDLSKSSSLKVGQTLTILPVTGVKYTIKTGDTLKSIAKRFGGDASEIAVFNGIDDATLAIGSEIVIPDGEVAAPAAPVRTPSKNRGIGAEPAHNVGPRGDASEIAFYIAPLAHYIETQGVHGYNAVDLAASIGTSIEASASGDVIVAKQGGYNGGYGSYVVIQHSNGSQTLYGHMSRVDVYDGQHVVQGQVIGAVGTTGKSTGPHLHFEIRDGIRNPF